MKYLLAVLSVATVLFVIIPVSSQQLYPSDFCSKQIYDRNGELLREVLSQDYKTSVWVSIDNISPSMIKATILREDRRFLFHHGVDLFALIRASWLNLIHGKVISGGSTITMQVAKMCLNLRSRSLLNKILETIYALKIELYLPKSRIMEIYLNRAPYGNQTYGVEAAARFYFRKSANHLSYGESCMLAVIPRAPTLMNAYISPAAVDIERRKLIQTLLDQHFIDRGIYEISLRERLNLVDQKVNFEAPHFVDYVLSRIPAAGINNATEVITTIDLRLQYKLEKMLSTTLRSLLDYHVHQGAVVVVSVPTGEILSMVGSSDYFDAKEGQVNGCTSARQPGSSLKPFLYSLALMSGMSLADFLPDTIVEFRVRDGTNFVPRNYSQKYHGPTRLREALASSFNVPAVYLIEELGIESFYTLLKRLRFQSLNRDAQHYGLSLSLGAGEVTLLELVNAYRVLARAGVVGELTCIREIYSRGGKDMIPDTNGQERVLPAEVAYMISDVLADDAGRFKAFGADNPLDLPFACAVKTGTSKDYRDNWCIGYSTDYVVGIWVGNFSGAPMQGISGITGAAPLFRDVMIELHRDKYPTLFRRPITLEERQICLRTGMLARAVCSNHIEEIFLPGTCPVDSCYGQELDMGAVAIHCRESTGNREEEKDLTILNPGNGDIFRIDPQVSSQSQIIKLRIRAVNSIESVKLLMDGKVIGVEQYPFEFLWQPIRGKHVLEAIAEKGDTDAKDRIAFTIY
ncbi:MAG: penicillin-binding protein 1C [candidate division WOR-3 bacterium]|nr:MAG: penicillin-binding protein 1C [candidate division WOR-3 bacterium]